MTLDDSDIDLGSAENDSDGDQIPRSKKCHLVKTADKKKDGSTSSLLPPTSPTTSSRAVLTADEKGKVVVDLKRKVSNAKIPFYYDTKTFSISHTPIFIKQIEEEN